MGIGTLRRYYKLKTDAAADRDESSMGQAFQAKQEATPGTPLPVDFPSRSKLVAARYGAVEDLRSATKVEVDEKELVSRAGLSRKEAKAVLAAIETL